MPPGGGHGADGASRQRIPVLAAIVTARGENASTLRKTVSRMRQSFRHHMKAQLAPTLAESTDMKDEMRALFAVLCGP